MLHININNDEKRRKKGKKGRNRGKEEVPVLGEDDEGAELGRKDLGHEAASGPVIRHGTLISSIEL